MNHFEITSNSKFYWPARICDNDIQELCIFPGLEWCRTGRHICKLGWVDKSIAPFYNMHTKNCFSNKGLKIRKPSWGNPFGERCDSGGKKASPFASGSRSLLSFPLGLENSETTTRMSWSSYIILCMIHSFWLGDCFFSLIRLRWPFKCV